MSDFKVEVCRIVVEKHPDPEVERLEIAMVGDYMTVVGKGIHQTGDLVAYIPEQSIVPDAIAEEIGLLGKLSGSQKNRVKAMRLRGVLSQGVVLKARPDWVEGQDVTVELGIVKYEVPEAHLPQSMRGRLAGSGFHFNFDVENIKKYNGAFEDGEEVVFTEKVHGTCCIIGWHKEAPNGVTNMFTVQDLYSDGGLTPAYIQIGTKNLSKQGVYFADDELSRNNVYCRTFLKHRDRFETLFCRTAALFDSDKVFVLGEVFGSGVQDLTYGSQKGEIKYRIFGICYYDRAGERHWLNTDELDEAISDQLYWDDCADPLLERVPIVYRGPFSKEILKEYTSGKDFSGSHMREGVMVQPVVERTVRGVGRLLLKSVSPEYLLRKGNTTEFA